MKIKKLAAMNNQERRELVAFYSRAELQGVPNWPEDLDDHQVESYTDDAYEFVKGTIEV